MTKQQLQAAFTCIRNVFISLVITYVGLYLLFGQYYTLEVHYDPDRETLLQFIFGWIEVEEL